MNKKLSLGTALAAIVITTCVVLPPILSANPNLASAEQGMSPVSPSLQLQMKIEEARTIASAQIKDLDPKSLTQGSIAPYYSSRTSGGPTGTVVSFTVAGTYRAEKLGEMVEKVIVIFPDDTKETVTARKTRIWLREGLLGITR